MRTSEFSQLPAVAPWITSPGPESDVVLACRIRLSRNLSEHPYPGETDSPDGDKTCEIVSEAIRNELTPEPFGVDAFDLDPRNISESEAGLLIERSVIEEPLPARVFLSADESIAVTLGTIDHLRIAAVSSGLSVQAALTAVQTVDCVLEHYLNYAVSLDWGYLSTEILNLGTAMRASVLLHVPALIELGRIGPITESLEKSGFDLVPAQLLEDDDDSIGLVILRNQRTLGLEEQTIAVKLEEYATKLVHYERAARQELVAERGVEVADAAHRALGILRFARSLSVAEARTMVSELRMGVAAGVVDDVTAETATMLFPLIQDNHVIASRLRSGNLKDGDGDIDSARAAVVRDALAPV